MPAFAPAILRSVDIMAAAGFDPVKSARFFCSCGRFNSMNSSEVTEHGESRFGSQFRRASESGDGWDNALPLSMKSADPKNSDLARPRDQSCISTLYSLMLRSMMRGSS